MKRSFFKSGILALSLIALFNITGYCDSEVSYVNSQKVMSKKGGGSVTVRLENSAIVHLDTGIVDVIYQNPNSSNQDSVITLCVIDGENEYTIASSELVKVGNQIQTLKLLEDRIDLAPGIHEGRYVLEHYNPETHEKAAVSAKFNGIKVTVK